MFDHVNGSALVGSFPFVPFKLTLFFESQLRLFSLVTMVLNTFRHTTLLSLGIIAKVAFLIVLTPNFILAYFQYLSKYIYIKIW